MEITEDMKKELITIDYWIRWSKDESIPIHEQWFNGQQAINHLYAKVLELMEERKK